MTPTDPETGKTYGTTPLEVAFDASGSTDDESDPLTYEWDFDCPKAEDGRCDFARFASDADGARVTHTYQTEGVYAAGLRVSDDQGNSDIAQIVVFVGNTPPQPVIESPALGEAFFRVNQQVTLKGSATDDEDQGLDLMWGVIRHHAAPNEHTHPSILDMGQSTGSSVTFSAPGPEDLRSTNPDGNYLEVRLTATDSQGLSKTVTRDLKPLTTNVRFATEPLRLYLNVNGERIRVPRSLLAWEGANLNVYAPRQKQGGERYAFRTWTDGVGSARRAITVPEEYDKYTAAIRRE